MQVALFHRNPVSFHLMVPLSPGPHPGDREGKREKHLSFITLACVLVRGFSGVQISGQVIRKIGPGPSNPIETIKMGNYKRT